MNASFNGQDPASGLDMPFLATFFRNIAARSKTEQILTLRSLAPRVKTRTAATKDKLPWLKLARFGEAKTPLVPRIDGSGQTTGGSLRNDANVLEITGIEADYDLEQMPIS